MNPLTLLIPFCVIAGVVLTVAMLFALAEAAIDYLRDGRNRSQLVIAGAYAIGFLVAGIAGWQLLTPGWPLSFGTTLKASVDSATYGHPVEHVAENLLVATEFMAVGCGLACAIAVGIAPRLIPRLPHE